MVQHRFTGAGAQAFLSSLCPSSLHTLAPFTSTLSVLLSPSGGIIDDTIIGKQQNDESFYVVTNAGRAAEDKALFTEKLAEWNAAHADKQVKWELMEGWGLLALQGPKSAEVLKSMTSHDLTKVGFGSSVWAEIGDDKVKCHFARAGYTGEDGFEVSSHRAVLRAVLISPDCRSARVGLGCH